MCCCFFVQWLSFLVCKLFSKDSINPMKDCLCNCNNDPLFDFHALLTPKWVMYTYRPPAALLRSAYTRPASKPRFQTTTAPIYTNFRQKYKHNDLRIQQETAQVEPQRGNRYQAGAQPQRPHQPRQSPRPPRSRPPSRPPQSRLECRTSGAQNPAGGYRDE